MKKFFFDTEFTGLHKNTTLISLGIISDCGKSFYAEFTDYDKSQVDDWIEKNVIKNLWLKNPFSKSNGHITFKGETKDAFSYINMWLAQFDLNENNRAQFWADVPAYDWVLFQSLFGTAFDMPSCIHYMPMDVATLFQIKALDPDTSRLDFARGKKASNKMTHNALWDAETTKLCYEKLIAMP